MEYTNDNCVIINVQICVTDAEVEARSEQSFRSSLKVLTFAFSGLHNM